VKKVKASAPGKLILSGEHAVVYGKPEIITAINHRLRVTLKERKKESQALTFISKEPTRLVNFAVRKIFKILDKKPKRNLEIHIDSEIPVGSGLGSSAALAVATTAALWRYFRQPFNKERLNEIAYEIEKKQHGTPSGGDNTIATYGGFLWYRKETEFLKIFKPLPLNLDKLPHFVLIDTGRPRETTGEMVAKVRERYQRNRGLMDKIFREMESVTREMFIALNRANKKKLRETIRKNEELLEKISVVGSLAKKTIREIEKSGGGAKVCGAGGIKKGSGIVLAYHPRKENLLRIARARNLPTFEVKLGEKGVRYERTG